MKNAEMQENGFIEWLLQETLHLKPIHFDKEKFPEREYLKLAEVLTSFERQWNDALENGCVHDNIYTEFMFLGMMHQVFEENGIAHEDVYKYLGKEKHPAQIIVEEFVETDKDLLFRNKGFSFLGPIGLSDIQKYEELNPLFILLMPCYKMAYEKGKDMIKTFKEEDYPGADYRFWKPE